MSSTTQFLTLYAGSLAQLHALGSLVATVAPPGGCWALNTYSTELQSLIAEFENIREQYLIYGAVFNKMNIVCMKWL